MSKTFSNVIVGLQPNSKEDTENDILNQIVHTPPSFQKRFGTATLHGNKMFPSLKYDWIGCK